jgi:hypothetical protein
LPPNSRLDEELVQGVLLDDPGFLRGIVEGVLEHLPEAEITETLERLPTSAPKAALGEAFRVIHGGHTNRLVENGMLTLVDFVDEHTDQDGTRPTWEELMQLWNVRGLGQHYDDYRTFSKAYRRAREKLAPRHL